LARAQLVLGTLDADLAASADHDVHLFLFIPSVVVLRPLGVGRQLELVDPECRNTEDFPHRPEIPLHIDVTPLRDVVGRDVIRGDDPMGHCPPRGSLC
jgi:hypothetical protein